MIMDKFSAVWHRIASPLHVRALRAAGISVGKGVSLIGGPIVSREGRSSSITIDDDVRLVSSSRWTALGAPTPIVLRTLSDGASIEIGARTGASGVQICAATSVKIGQRCLLGSGVRIFDTDFHYVDAVPRAGLPIPQSSLRHAVMIEDDVFIGAGAMILKGVRIGRGAVVAAGSVVTRDVAQMTVVAGNPAAFVRRVDVSKQCKEPDE